MKQVGFETGWLHFLQHYVQPLQQRVFEGYWNDVRSKYNYLVFLASFGVHALYGEGNFSFPVIYDLTLNMVVVVTW